MATSKRTGRCAVCGGVLEVGTPISKTARGWASAECVAKLHAVIRDGMGITDARAWLFVLPPLPRGQGREPAATPTSAPKTASQAFA